MMSLFHYIRTVAVTGLFFVISFATYAQIEVNCMIFIDRKLPYSVTGQIYSKNDTVQFAYIYGKMTIYDNNLSLLENISDSALITLDFTYHDWNYKNMNCKEVHYIRQEVSTLILGKHGFVIYNIINLNQSKTKYYIEIQGQGIISQPHSSPKALRKAKKLYDGQ